jgi:dihydropyrimidine dehydrogenase (NAD+) subunit PreT
MKETNDIEKARIKPQQLNENFCDLTPALDFKKAKIESQRCYFCYDAPCIKACPTTIDIPSFIRKISTDNVKGAAMDILKENIMGGTCSRVCPVETLCEDACVRNTSEDKPVAIGQLQRYATDWLFSKKIQPFQRAASTGRKIAVIGAGPAGLSCAHRLAQYGHAVDVFEAKPKAGGLNEYGLAAYKVVDNWAQKEVKFILDIGGITVKYGKALGRDITLEKLRNEYDAVFLGVGLNGTNSLGVEGENVAGVSDAVDYIAKLRQSLDMTELPVPRRAVVIGGGNTAIDIAVQVKKLGAEEVTLVYRRDEAQMKATWHEREIAKNAGVLIRTWLQPKRVLSDAKGVTAIEFERTSMQGGKLVGLSETVTLAADMVFKAIGQVLVPTEFGDTSKLIEISKGKILVDEHQQTTLKGVYAGGDCVNGGDLTVTSVQHGKIAAEAIHKNLGAN